MKIYPKGKAYWEDHERLLEIFPRGRFRADDDGSCILVAKRRARAKDKGYIGPGRCFAVYHEGLGRGRIYLDRARDLLVGRLDGDLDGILQFRWDKSLSERFPWFSRKAVKAGLAANLKGTDSPEKATWRG
jgi:hypothetical protein